MIIHKYTKYKNTICNDKKQIRSYQRMVDGKWAIVSEFIKGKTLAQLIEEDPDNKDKYLEMLVDVQLEINSKTSPLLNKLKDKMNRKISACELDATTRYDLHTRLDSMPKHNKVCHGDLNPSNIVITEDGTPHRLSTSPREA